MKISISLPSLYPDLLDAALRHLHPTLEGFDVEILVVSPFEAKGPNVRWVPEKVQTGNCAAHALAWEHSTGDVIVTLTDDLLPDHGWLPAVLNHLSEGESRNPVFATGINYFTGKLGTAFGIYYPYLPVLSRRTLEVIGGYFSRDYGARYGDIDIAMRVWNAGGKCAPCLDSTFRPLEERGDDPESVHKFTSMDRDFDTFMAKWKDIYGKSWPTETVRDFNIDIFQHALDYVMEDGTIFMNDPKFRDIIYKYYRALNLSYGSVDHTNLHK